MIPQPPLLKPRPARPVRHGTRTRDAASDREGSAGVNGVKRLRRAATRKRQRVEARKLADVRIRFHEKDKAARTRRSLWLLAAMPLLLVMLVLQANEPPAPPEPGQVFLFEDIPPAPEPPARPDPSPPPPAPPVEKPEEAPPPQFGLQEEQLSEAGGLEVATGNTLMTEADSMVKEPVAALPAEPEIMNQAPRILKGRPPEYPLRALERGLEATVVVIISIDTLGRVSRVDIEQSGGVLFDGEVVRAVKRLVFQPPVRNGQRMEARFRQPYEFRIQ